MVNSTMTNTMVAIEVTTQCNFDCDYCYTKNYPNKMMDMDTFKRIIREWASYPGNVDFSLSGEGESLLHPQFWDFVQHIRTTTKHKVSLITNGSTLTPTNIQKIRDNMDIVRVSLDTMDPDMAERVGRHFHSRVVQNIRLLAKTGIRMLVMTTNFGQDIDPVGKFVKSLNQPNALHVTQPLQPKADYASGYTMFEKPIQFVPRKPSYVQCGNIIANSIIMYTVDGLKLPCCYIKDRSAYPGYESMVKMMTDPTNTTIPPCCTGCSLLTYRRMDVDSK